MSLLTTAQLAEMAGITKRQLQRILDAKKVDLGARRTPGGHWEIPDTLTVRRWAKRHRRWKRPSTGIQLNPGDKSRVLVTIEGISCSFNLWHRKMADEIPQWNERQMEAALQLMDEQARVHAQIKQQLQRRRQNSGSASTARSRASA
ncbi:MAG: hypothetical protein ACO3JG_14040 [Luteolibacter sp.]